MVPQQFQPPAEPVTILVHGVHDQAHSAYDQEGDKVDRDLCGRCHLTGSLLVYNYTLAGVFVSDLACLPNKKVRLRSEVAPSFAKIFGSKTRPAFITVKKTACLRRPAPIKEKNSLRSPAVPL